MSLRADRPGFALVICLLLALVLSMMTAGMLAMAERESEIAAAWADLLAARVRAEGGVREALARGAIMPDSLVRGEPSLVLSEPGRDVHAERLEGGLLLLRSEARVHRPRRPPAVARAGLLLVVADSHVAPGPSPPSYDSSTPSGVGIDTSGAGPGEPGERLFRPPSRWWIPVF